MTIAPQKQLGQNFLKDQFYLQKIIKAIAPQKGEAILEIGPGTGALTAELLKSGAHVTAIEKDPRCAPILEKLKQQYPCFTFHIADALKLSFKEVAPQATALVGNLPYNIGTQIVLNGLLQNHFKKHVFLLQKEVVSRICAHPQTADWGRLAIACQQKANCENLFDVPAGAFFPPPKVTSSVVRLTTLPEDRYPCAEQKLEMLTQAAFSKRRKMLRTSLKGFFSEAELLKLGIEPTQRPENLPLEAFAKLTNALK